MGPRCAVLPLRAGGWGPLGTPFVAVCLALFALSALLGGIIGLEREFRLFDVVLLFILCAVMCFGS